MSQFQPTFFQGLVVVTLYLLPSLIAACRRTTHLGTGFLVNILLGWTIVGWVYSFIWAMFADRQGEALGELRLSLPLRNAAPTQDRQKLRRAA